MTDCKKPEASSGTLYIGQTYELKKWMPWLRSFYAENGMNFRDLRKHVLTEFSFLLPGYDFRTLLDWYIHTRYYENLQVLCCVANDDKYNGLTCRDENSRYCDPASSADYTYPTMTQHPMAAFKGHRVTKFGYLPHDALVDRLGS
jgi:hypothetical protein